MIASIVLGIVGVLMVIEGLLEWRRNRLGIIEAALMLGGIALLCVSIVWHQAADQARFARTLKPSMHLDMSPPAPLAPSVRPPMLPRPGPERVGDSLIIA